MSENSIFSDVVPALIGAISGSIGGNFLTDWFNRKAEREKNAERVTVHEYFIYSDIARTND